METHDLEQHITDTIKEWQMKIGYAQEHMRLYYPAQSLKELLKLPEHAAPEELEQALGTFAEEVKERLGELGISHKKDRYCLDISEQGCRYIAERVKDNELLRRLLQVLNQRTGEMDPVRRVFEEYARELGGTCVEEDRREDGLGLVFFYDRDEVDPYVYCMEQDEFGITYHRFSKADYQKLLCEGTHTH